MKNICCTNYHDDVSQSLSLGLQSVIHKGLSLSVARSLFLQVAIACSINGCF